MFCSNCGHKLENEYKYCTHCETKISSDEKRPFPTENMMLFSEKMNWGQIALNTGAWLYTKWAVYTDKTVIKETKYDGSIFLQTNNQIYNKTYVMEDKDFNELKIWVNKIFPHISAGKGCDGTGWKITSFDESGKLVHSTTGYTYGISSFETMIDILENK